jgi:GT2 family glycosyltransferase
MGHGRVDGVHGAPEASIMIAVVMPVVNCEAYTEAALKSLNSTREHTEIIVIDNASTDGTPDMLRAFKAVDPFLSVLRQEKNIGVAASWNLGIRRAFNMGCDPVIVANNDIVCARDTIDALVDAMRANESFGLLSARSVAIPSPDGLDVCVRSHYVLEGPVDFCLFAIRPSTFAIVGDFDEDFWPAYYEDRDYIERMRRARLSFGMAYSALVFHHGSRSIREGGVKNYPYFKANQRRFLAKHPTATL